MKWLLITTLGTNPGDEFARIGVQKLIREVDPVPEFDLLNKENPDHYCPRDFDRAIICGMPLWWSTKEQDNYDIWWWDKIFESWISENKRNFMVLGAGHVYVDKIYNFAKYAASIDYVTRKAWAVTVREPVISHPGVIDSICPSAFATRRIVNPQSYNLCNMMVDSGHFPHDSREKLAWNLVEPDLVKLLQQRNYIFVAHTREEEKLAVRLGWPQSMIRWFDNPEAYLKLYAGANKYFGHRLHGAAVCSALGIPAWGVAYDSRMKMVHRLGGHATLPSEIFGLKQWLRDESRITRQPSHDVSRERLMLTDLLIRFAAHE